MVGFGWNAVVLVRPLRDIHGFTSAAAKGTIRIGLVVTRALPATGTSDDAGQRGIFITRHLSLLSANRRQTSMPFGPKESRQFV